MNIITETLFAVYFYFLFKLNTPQLLLILTGIIFPYFEDVFLYPFKNKFRFKNKIFHSLVTSFVIVFFVSLFFDVRYSFIFIWSGYFIHLFSDLIKSKKISVYYPFSSKKISLGISNYFDVIPVIILMISNFIMILFENKIGFFERFLPLGVILSYFVVKYFIKRIIYEKITENLNGDKIIVQPTLRFNIWNIIKADKHNVYIFGLDILKRKYVFIKYFKNTADKDCINTLEDESLMFNEFRNENKKLYYQMLSDKKDRKIIRVFDLENFFNLFKKEQVYYEALVKDKKIIKEKTVL